VISPESLESALNVADLRLAEGDLGSELAASSGSVTAAPPAAISAAPASGPIRIELLPGKIGAEAGSVFEVSVYVEARQAVAHLPVTLTFDPGVLAVEEVSAGPLFGEEEARVLADFGSPGRLVLAASKAGRGGGVIGENAVARIRFRAVGTGETWLNFEESRALGPDLEPVGPVEVGSTRVVVVAGSGSEVAAGGVR